MMTIIEIKIQIKLSTNKQTEKGQIHLIQKSNEMNQSIWIDIKK